MRKRATFDCRDLSISYNLQSAMERFISEATGRSSVKNGHFVPMVTETEGVANFCHVFAKSRTSLV